MPGDLAIQSILAAGAAARPATVPAVAPATLPPAYADGERPNPSMRIDPALGLVVVEFRDAAGRVTASLPDARQLDAYHAAQRAAVQPAANAVLHKPATRMP